jgi:hypothetical protein
MGTSSGRWMVLLALTISLFEITPAPGRESLEARRSGATLLPAPGWRGADPRSHVRHEQPRGGAAAQRNAAVLQITTPTDGTHIFVGLETLAAQQPTLAALADPTRPQVGNILSSRSGTGGGRVDATGGWTG